MAPALSFQLHVITARLGEPRAWLPGAVAAAAGGADWIQLRDGSRSTAALDLVGYVQQLREAGARRISVNDRLDVALATRTEGVHLSARSLPVAAARELVGGRLLVGRSVHGVAEARQAAADGADYLTFGHVFPSTSKPGLPPRGPEQLAEVVEAVEVPVLAIGGIGLDNLESVLATGCAGIAVISAVLSAAEPRRAAQELRQALDASRHRPRFGMPEAASLAVAGAAVVSAGPVAAVAVGRAGGGGRRP